MLIPRITENLPALIEEILDLSVIRDESGGDLGIVEAINLHQAVSTIVLGDEAHIS